VVTHEDRQRPIERDDELAALDAVVAGALAADGAAALVRGPAGIGKSRLLAAGAARAAQAGALVLRARAAELERDFSFALARQLFEPVVVAAGPSERAGLMAGAARLAAVAVLPGEERPGPVAGDQLGAVLHGLH